jgi:hypothetical protein
MNRTSQNKVLYSFRLPFQDYKALEKAEAESGISLRNISKLAIKHFIESGELDRLKTGKAV